MTTSSLQSIDRSTRRFIAAMLAVGVLPACGSGSTTEPVPTTRPASSSSSPDPSGPDDTLVVAGGVTTLPAAGGAEDAEVLRPGVELTAGTRYRSDVYAPLVSVSFVNPVDGSVGDVGGLGVGVFSDASYRTTLISVNAIDGAFTYADPLQSLESITDFRSASAAMGERVPDDFLGWLSSLPGVTATPAETTTLGGFPAERTRIVVDHAPAGAPTCGDVRCLSAYTDGTGLAFVLTEGDPTIDYAVSVDGVRFHVSVLDRPEGQAVLESLRFTSSAAELPVGIERLPQWGPLETGASYGWATAAGDRFTVEVPGTTSAGRVGSPTSFQLPNSRVPGTGDLALLDPADVAVNEDESARPLPISPDGPASTSRPDDLLAALAEHPAAEVVEPISETRIGGLPARTIGLRAVAGPWAFACTEDQTVICTWPLEPRGVFLRSDVVTRIATIAGSDGRPALVVVTNVGTPGETIAASIRPL